MIAINNSVTALNANGSPLVITTPVTALKKGKIRVMVSTLVSTKNRLLTLVSSPVSTKKAFYKWIPEGKNKTKYSNAYQNGKSYLWQAIALLSRLHNKDAFNCHQNGYKVTKTVTKYPYQNSKLFTKTVKAGYEFPNDIKRAWLIIGVHKKGLIVFRHVRRELSDTLANKSYLTGLFSFSRQALITHAEKLELSFFARSSICSMSSWGKRISLRLVIFVSLAIIIINSLILRVRTVYTKKEYKKSIDLCGHNNIYCADRFLINPYFNDSPKYWHTKDYLTKPLKEVMIMAKSYDSAHLRAEQSKVFKFYNILTAQTVQTIATSDEQARKNLGKQSLIFIARKPINPIFERSINWGGYSHA